MQVTIIPDDAFVSVDGRGFGGLDFTIAPNIHAVQWYGNAGEVEYRVDVQGVKAVNAVINDLSFCQTALDAWEAARAAADVPPPEPTPEVIYQQFVQAVQNMLDDKAKERNYDGIMSACSYVGSSNPKFAGEAVACMDWRDAVWSACYAALDAVLAGHREIPTIESFLAELPKMEWPL